MSPAPPAKFSVIVSATAPATFADGGSPLARVASSAGIEETRSPSTVNASGMRLMTPSGSL